MFKKHFSAILVTLLFSLFAFALALNGAEKKPPETVILKGAPMGGVKFQHKLHQERAAKKCETCHHPSKPEKALSAPQQACFDCHTKPATAPMKTDRKSTRLNSSHIQKSRMPSSA